MNSSSKIELELNLNLNPPQNTMYVCMLYNCCQELFFKMKKKNIFYCKLIVYKKTQAFDNCLGVF